jgi:hypothetical protein
MSADCAVRWAAGALVVAAALFQVTVVLFHVAVGLFQVATIVRIAFKRAVIDTVSRLVAGR